ncbi:E3 ubiquitin-protein ligase TRIM37-like isoform X3 [Bolinopsis microptera]|uniref:E3 ubiquitin-protein ligase TRIM37-like isoform X3 n=1 Tax=Bolinopsis microptera TaxID=2820187 RepID=UPI00307A7CB6
MAESEVESLTELFRCFICMQPLQSARLCPHCSKLCCAPCVERWLLEQRQECPHCREPLQRGELVKCRWAEEVTQQLESMRSLNHESKAMERQLERDKCVHHEGEKLSVFCISCQMCICHLCALFVGQHSGHSFKPLDEEYEVHKKKITDEISALRKRLMELDGIKRDIEKNVETVKFAKENREDDMRTVYDGMVKKLESQLKNKLNTLKGQKNSICNETEFLEKILFTVERELKQKSKSELINSVGHLMDMFSKVHETPMTNFTSAPVPADFVSEIVPQYQSASFVLRNFSMLKRKADPVYSSHLNCNGIKWRLKVYPDGNGVARSNYLSVFLELVEGVSETSKYEYKVEMLQHNCNGTRSIANVVREFASDFEVGECWGYNRFFRLDQLEEGGYLDTEEDCVVLKFHVRPPTFAQKCRDQTWYISSLEESQSQHIEQLNNLKMSLKERSRVLHDARPHAECVPARDVTDRTDRTENSIEANDMNSTRNVDPDDLFDLTDLPPPFENSEEEEEEEEEGDENDSTLQKIRYSIQLVGDEQRPLSADSWERRLMNQIGVSSFPGTAEDTLNTSHPASEPGDKLDHPRTLHVEHHHSRVTTSRNSNCVADNEMDIEALDHNFDIRLLLDNSETQGEVEHLDNS